MLGKTPSTYWHYNLPTKGNCFVCLKDGMCVILTLSDENKAAMMKHATNPLMEEVFQDLGNAQFVVCQDCKQDRTKVADMICSFITDEYNNAARRGFYKKDTK